MATRRLTIYLLQNVSDFEEALDDEKQPIQAEMSAGLSLDVRFYYRSRRPRPPDWLDFVAPALTSTPAELQSSSASGLLILRSQEQFFALSFGYGRAFLDQAKIRRRFGLRVALNAIDPTQLRSMDTKTFEDMVVTRNVQSSRSSDLPAFGIDISRDILRAATGEPRDNTLAKRISGADALVVNANITIGDLPEYCDMLMELYRGETYKEDFGWIDQLALVESQELIEQLDNTLVEQLQANETSQTHLAMPDPIEPADVDCFKISGTQNLEYDDLDLDLYLENVGTNRSAITLDRLKSRKVSVRYSRGPDFDSRWSIYQCLVSEQRVEQKLYALIEGRWFAISETLAAEVDQFAKSLDPSSLTLPASMADEKEPDYIRRAAEAIGESVMNVDARIKRPGGAASGIELCDILTLDRELVHIKRKSRSSTLSHLFAQGRISATTLLQDEVYRDRIRKEIASRAPEGMANEWLNTIPAGSEPLNPADFRVSYAVITNTAQPGHGWIPFFSKLNLMQTGRELQRMGFSVSLDRVSVQDP